jgi:hypothetical protein
MTDENVYDPENRENYVYDPEKNSGWVELDDKAAADYRPVTSQDRGFQVIEPQREISSTQEAAFEIGRLVKETFGDIFPEDVMILVAYETISRWQDTIVSRLRTMVDEWDKTIEDDKSLYTLGLRRAIDIVEGNNPVL